jgi:hypothetical protein
MNTLMVVGSLIGLAFLILFVSIFRVSHGADEELKKMGLVD